MLVQISEGCGPGWGVREVRRHSNIASTLTLQTPTSLYRYQEKERKKGKEEKKETSEKKCDIATQIKSFIES